MISAPETATQSLLLPTEAAQILRLSPRTLEKMRTAGSSLRFVRLGRRVLYSQTDIADYVTANTVRSTAEVGRAV